MGLSLVIDDTSLVLLVLIVSALAISVYVSRSFQPLIHPLILSRQADVSQVRQPGESAVYRNANSPSGFDLAQKPRKEVTNLAKLLANGALGSELNHERPVQNVVTSNASLSRQAAQFANGLLKLSSTPAQQTCLAVSQQSDNFPALVALLSACHLGGASSFHTVVIPTSTITDKVPTELPSQVVHIGARTISALVSTAEALPAVLRLSVLDPSALVILPSESQVRLADANAAEHYGGSHRLRLVAFDDVVKEGQLANATPSDKDNLKSTHSFYWLGNPGWVSVTHGNLIAGVTTHLGFFPSDKIPSSADRIFVETKSHSESASASLSFTHSPAGLTLVLLALYTGSAFTADQISTSTDDRNASLAFSKAEPTLIYASPQGASSLACALTNVSRRSPLASQAFRSKLYSLRNGTYSRAGLSDALSFSKARASNGCTHVRNVMICGSGSSITQGLLDSLRVHLGCSVLNAYLPTSLLFARAPNGLAAVVTAPLSCAHGYDLQAFADHERDGMQVPAHVGPPSVSVELKLASTDLAQSHGLRIAGDDKDGYRNDPMGEVLVRGKVIAGRDDDGDWYRTGDLGGFRSNGTLVVFKDSTGTAAVRVPKLNARENRTRVKGKLAGATSAVSMLAVLSVIGCSIQPADASGLSKRAINNTLAEVARMGMLAGQRASWEQGTGQSALLELDHAPWTVFTSKNGGPPFKPSNIRADAGGAPYDVLAMAYQSVARQDRLGRLSFRVTGDEVITTGSALDGASCGEHVVLAGWLYGEFNQETGQIGGGYFADAAERQLNYILDDVPRSEAGAISHRAMTTQLWSDAIYMGPPFIAYYGLVTRNDTLLQIAYDQIRLYRDVLQLTDGGANNLWGHIRYPNNGTWTDEGAWATGNGWVTAGMLRVLATIQQSEASSAMSQQKEDLLAWVNEVLDAAYPLLDEDSMLFHNYMNDTNTFLDSAGTALLVYSTFRLASLAPEYSRHVDTAEQIYNRLQTSLTPMGIFGPEFETVDVLGFTHEGPTSSESLSFVMLMDAARRDYRNEDTVRISEGDSNGSALLVPPFAAAILSAVALAMFAAFL